ncbi:MAG: GNAT family N-acetyltransferase [Candidatus Eisenbacteria bacterium]
MNLRRLTPDDAVAYRALMLEAYSETPIVFGTAPHEAVAQPDSWWRARCSAEPDSAQLVIGAFDGATLAGALGVQFAQRERERHKATLFGMFVKPAARGNGLGRALVEAALDAARAREGVRVAQLAAIEGNDGALQLYERCGFARWGVEPMCFANPERGFVARVQLWREL